MEMNGARRLYEIGQSSPYQSLIYPQYYVVQNKLCFMMLWFLLLFANKVCKNLQCFCCCSVLYSTSFHKMPAILECEQTSAAKGLVW